MKKGLLSERESSSYSKGFSLIELLMVVSIVVLLLALAGAFSPKSYHRRTVDSVTVRVANTLQLAKLRASRQGVEFRTRFIESEGNLRLVTERGDSNTDSSLWIPVNDGVIDIKLDSSVEIFKLPSRFEFNPNGTAGPSNSFIVISKEATDLKRCGRVVVSALGRIGVLQGHWESPNCIQVEDR